MRYFFLLELNTEKSINTDGINARENSMEVVGFCESIYTRTWP